MWNLKAVLRSRRPLAKYTLWEKKTAITDCALPLLFSFSLFVYFCVFPTFSPLEPLVCQVVWKPQDCRDSICSKNWFLSSIPQPTKQCIDFSWWFILTPFLKPGYKAKLTKWWWDKVIKQSSCFRFYYLGLEFPFKLLWSFRNKTKLSGLQWLS